MSEKQDAIRALARLRYSARIWASLEDRVRSDAQELERDAAKLEKQSPFYLRQAEELRAKARELRQNLFNTRKTEPCLKPIEIGILLRQVASDLQDVTTLAERCELLNVNIADRGDLTEDDDIFMIAYAHGLENSKTFEKAECNDAPLARCARAAMMDFITNTQEGQEAASAAFDEVFGDVFPIPGERPIAADGQAPGEPKPTLH